MWWWRNPPASYISLLSFGKQSVRVCHTHSTHVVILICETIYLILSSSLFYTYLYKSILRTQSVNLIFEYFHFWYSFIFTLTVNKYIYIVCLKACLVIIHLPFMIFFEHAHYPNTATFISLKINVILYIVNPDLKPSCL